MIRSWELTIPQLSPELVRRAYLYLPEMYEDEPHERFPVLYMFDGQNLFFDEDASFGKSWGLYDYLTENAPPLIVAAVSCNTVGDGRLIEYSPFAHTTKRLGAIRARGRTTMNWLTRCFKPQIDSIARTLPDREHTLIAGSSMGGLMSLYAALDYNDVFSRAACLSPSLWVSPEKVRRMIAAADPAPDTCVYLDYGSREMGNHGRNEEALHSACAGLLSKGVDLTFRIVPGGTHSEASWQERLPIMFKCLGF